MPFFCLNCTHPPPLLLSPFNRVILKRGSSLHKNLLYQNEGDSEILLLIIMTYCPNLQKMVRMTRLWLLWERTKMVLGYTHWGKTTFSVHKFNVEKMSIKIDKKIIAKKS